MKISDIVDKMPAASAMSALEALAEKDPVLWCALNRRVKGEPLVYDNSRKLTEEVLGEVKQTMLQSDYEFELNARLLHHRPFLKEPARDNHKHKVYEKGRQVGVTELSASEVFHFLATHPGTKWISCVPDDAEILTRCGWKLYTELKKSDEALVLDNDKRLTRWEPILEVKSYDFRGFLSSVGPYPFHCTANHRWPVDEKTTMKGKKIFKRKIVEAWHLKQHHTLIRMAPHQWNEQRSILSARHAALLGWVVTDGHQWKTGTKPNLNTVMMEISQNERKHLREIEKLSGIKAQPCHAHTNDPTIAIGGHGGRIVGLKDENATNPRERFLYGGQYRVRLAREDVNAILKCGYETKADLPALVARLAPPAAEAMWDAMVKAEGNRSGKKGRSLHFTQLHGPVLEAFQILCVLTGRSANLNARGAYVIDAESRSSKMRAVYKEQDDRDRYYIGKVWCPRTPSGTWCMRYRGRVVFTGNTFPRDKQLTDFSITRVAHAFGESPRMAALAGTPNQVFTKRVGDSYWIFRSAWESNLGEGVDADGVTLDEKDRMRDKVELAFRESLKSSRYGLLREISTPTLPNQGIDIPFRASDQRVWMVKCERCNEWQEINYQENIIQVKDIPLGCKELPPESYEYLCHKQKCRGKLDRVFTGRWVARYPDRNHIRGYHMPQLIAPWISATRVMQDKIDFRFREVWLCYVIGIPASGELEMLTDLDFELACANHEMVPARTRDWTHVTAGIDWGNVNWCVVMGRNALNQRPYILNIGIFEDEPGKELSSAKAMENFLAPYAPDLVIADAGYGKDRNSYLMRKLCPVGNEGRFYAQWYNPSQKSSRTFQPEFSDPTRGRVLVDRTMALKNICHSIKQREFGIPTLSIDKVQLLIRHMKNLAPFREVDEESKEIIETVRSAGDDHLAHALASAWLGMEKLSKMSRFGFSFE